MDIEIDDEGYGLDTTNVSQNELKAILSDKTTKAEADELIAPKAQPTPVKPVAVPSRPKLTERAGSTIVQPISKESSGKLRDGSSNIDWRVKLIVIILLVIVAGGVIVALLPDSIKGPFVNRIMRKVRCIPTFWSYGRRRKGTTAVVLKNGTLKYVDNKDIWTFMKANDLSVYASNAGVENSFKPRRLVGHETVHFKDEDSELVVIKQIQEMDVGLALICIRGGRDATFFTQPVTQTAYVDNLRI